MIASRYITVTNMFYSINTFILNCIRQFKETHGEVKCGFLIFIFNVLFSSKIYAEN